MKKLLSKVYSGVTHCRNYLYDNELLKSYKVNLPVICVGNVIVGGAGKTPITKELASRFAALGYYPVILSRGYAGRLKGPLTVSTSADFLDVGDEPLMLVRTADVPVVVAKNRVSGAKFIEEQGLGNLIILDDGFQHRRLKRDLNILSFDISSDDALYSLNNNLLLPYGLLREDLASALKRVDLLIAAHRGPKLGQEKINEFEHALGGKNFDGQLWINSGEVVSFNSLKNLNPQAIVALSSIARPAGFAAMLKALNFEVEHHKILADHDPELPKAIKYLINKYPSLPIVCTEKDIVKVNKEDKIADHLYYLKANYTLELNPNAEHMLNSLKRV